MTTLRQLLKRYGGTFIVPAYQRRYVWGQVRPGERDSAARLMEQIIEGYSKGHGPYFLQGITLGVDANASPPRALIIDGQQRLTFLALLLVRLGHDVAVAYQCRPAAQEFFGTLKGLNGLDEHTDTQDTHFMAKSLRTIDEAIQGADRDAMLDYVLDNITFMVIEVPQDKRAITAFRMINGTKAPMQPADIIKAELMRLATDHHKGHQWDVEDMRARYAAEWEDWVRWWHRADVSAYYSICSAPPMELLINLCLGPDTGPLTYERFREALADAGANGEGPGDFFYRLRCTQRRFEEAYETPETYNRIKAVMLLQDAAERTLFLHRYFVVMDIDGDRLETLYKLSFLGMTTTQILRGDSPEQHFEEMLATVGLSDVYHNPQAKAETFKLLLRLNIDEDIKLGRRFDFSVWNNRSLEHIYSKSKVWHKDAHGRVCDGNDNDLRTSPQRIAADPAFMHRALITNYDGMPLSEHCIGNLVLLYGQNNADFGNASFDQKKLMFLTPGGMTAFRSRNLLHSVCVFAAKDWTAQSIVDNYNLTLKNLKQYYGYK